MNFDLQTYLIFGLGVLSGALIANAVFRKKFFVGLRKFLNRTSKGAQNLNQTYSPNRTRSEREYRPVSAIQDKPKVEHIYRQIHQKKTCPTCKGTGRVYKIASKLQEGAPGYKPEIIDCPTCKGETWIWN